MAADDSKTVELENQELDDKIICCICTNVYNDPKALPCIHTFCMKCLQENGLKTNKGPGDEMPCPICRRQFKIPEEGFWGLPNNFFIAKLIEVASVSELSESSKAFCDACLDDNEGIGKKNPEADMYCTECKQNLCDECCRHHRKLKLTRNHKLMQITELQVSDQNVVLKAANECKLHERRVLEIYCAGCKVVECAVCFIDGHKHHEGSHVSKFVDGFRKQIESNIETINECCSQTLVKKAELNEIKEDMQQKAERLEEDVMKRRDDVKQLADSQANSLLQRLCSLRQSKLKEIQIEGGDIDAHLSCLQSYNSHCQKIIAKGSASDICRVVSDLSVKATELQERCQSLIEREIQSFRYSFTKSEFKKFLEDDNLIGEIEEDCNPSQSKTCASKLALTEEQSNEIEEYINLERREKETFLLENEQLKMSVNNEKVANTILKEALNKNVTSYSAELSQLKLQLDNEKVTSKTLHDNTEKLVQKLEQELDIKKTLQVDIIKLKKDFDIERKTVEKLEQKLENVKMTNRTLRANADKLSLELNCEKVKYKTMENVDKKLGQEFEIQPNAVEDMLKGKEQTNEDWEKTKTGDLQYKSDPVLVQTIRTKSAKDKKKQIRGLTILDKELFVVSDRSSEVEVYDSIQLSFRRRWNLNELIRPMDLGGCNINKCLYILYYKGFDQSKEILRIDPNGNLIKNWSTGNDYGRGLSVTDESNVILTVFEKNKLNEYSPDGQLILEINLSGAGIRYPWHAVKLTNGHFVVSHGYYDDDLHRVCMVDADGKLEKKFGGRSGSTIKQMNIPFHLSVDGNGVVIVADRENRRVLLLDSDLEFKREIISNEKQGLSRPCTILLDESNGRLFVADNEPTDPRILIFDYLNN